MKSDAKLRTQEGIIEALKALKQKIVNFSVSTPQNRHLGTVQDIKLSRQGELHLAIARPNRADDSDSFYLPSRLIQQIDSPSQTIFVQPSNPSSMNSQDSNPTENLKNEVIRLLEEKLIVDRKKRKVGEVSVRKVIETRMVQVPVRREKLIVEKVGEEDLPLAEIDLGQGEVTGVEVASGLDLNGDAPTVQGEFFSVKAASDFLGAIALRPDHGCQRVRIELVVEDEQRQDTYQKLFDSCRPE